MLYEVSVIQLTEDSVFNWGINVEGYTFTFHGTIIVTATWYVFHQVYVKRNIFNHVTQQYIPIDVSRKR